MIKTTLLESGILHISLNRPEQLNALSLEILQQLASIFDQVKSDHSIQSVLLTGEGKVFCAGADIKQLAQYSLSNIPDKNHSAHVKKIAELSEKGLIYLKKFEEQVTGIKLLENPSSKKE